MQHANGDSASPAVVHKTATSIRYAMGESQLILDRTVQGAARTLVIGRGKAEFASLICEHWDSVLRTSGTLASFLDFADMRVYDSKFRTDLTEWAVSQLNSLQTIHAFSRSKVVLMGASLVALALGGRLVVHDTEVDFQRQVRAAGLPPRGV